MQKHTKTYMHYFGYGIDDFIPCEICGARVADVHHIKGRIGKDANNISNLMGLCRECHNDAHAEKWTDSELINIHLTILIR
jgi:hypothetical protein